MVQDYNDILEHKRKGAPNSPKAYSTRRKGGESRRKGGEERLLRLIQLQKTTLLTADLKTQIKINR